MLSVAPLALSSLQEFEMLTLYPSIHIKAGAVSHLTHSSRDLKNAALINPNPVECAKKLADQGFQWLHVVDLDAAFANSIENVGCIESIIKSAGIPVQISGGMRDMSSIGFWIERGAQNIVLTSAAQQNPNLIKEAASRFPGRIVARIDSMRGYAAKTGWLKSTSEKTLDVALRAESNGASSIILAEINVDGALSDINIETTVDLAFALTVPLIAAGGMHSLRDLERLKRYKAAGISGIILDSALYSDEIDAKEALKIALYKQDQT